MLTLEEIVNETAPIFESSLTLPEPPIKFKDQIEALEKANLPRQKAAAIYDMRKWQVEKLGLKELGISDAVKILMGQQHTAHRDGDKHKIEYVYNHHTGQIENAWTGTATIYYRKERIHPWYKPPFIKQIIWECQSGKLDYLKREIPYGVILKINELKELGIFNSFSAVAPIEAWWKQKDIDPIVLGHLWQLPPDDDGKYSQTGFATTFFIAKW